jgi:hypothetical protein
MAKSFISGKQFQKGKIILFLANGCKKGQMATLKLIALVSCDNESWF